MKYRVLRSASVIITGLDKVKQTYEERGFEIYNIFGDNEFDIQDIKKVLLPTKLHICAEVEHGVIVERSTRTIN